MNSIQHQIRVGISRLKRLNYRHVIPDALLIILSLYASLWLRLGWADLENFLPVMHRHVLLFLFIRLGTFVVFGVYDIIWRYFSMKDAERLIGAVLLSSVVIIAASYVVDIGRLPRAVFFIDTFLVATFLGGIRFGRRWLFEGSFGKQLSRSGNQALIFGAGVNGRTLASRFNTDSFLGFKLVGFVDDNPQKAGRTIGGVKVLGNRKDLPDLIKNLNIRELIVAVSQPPGDLLRELVQVCRSFNIQPRVMAGATLTTGRQKNVEVVREIGLNDLLNRPRKEMSLDVVRNLVRNKCVLVTGAGGSIGSELARQIYSFNPQLLLLLDHSELNLYNIDQELRLSSNDTSLVKPLLVDIKDREQLRHVFQEYIPEIVFHAAAYKHVHLVENNPYPAILNNVLGTRNLLELSHELAVDSFILISTDKAVRPGGIMGATKRICELLVAELGERTGKQYTAVRFGNVLGSSGSLIPLLQKQIENGEPLTITHKGMTRYFMLIPEAVSLVLKAAGIAKPGDITILRMGDPVKIVDIAKSMITLMGKKEKEYPIIFTGLRPGEKLFEELYISGDELQTEDPDILVLPRGDCAAIMGFTGKRVWTEVDSIIALAKKANREAVVKMNAMVKTKYVTTGVAMSDKNEFTPSKKPRESSVDSPRIWQ